jgi:hypothetical protein
VENLALIAFLSGLAVLPVVWLFSWLGRLGMLRLLLQVAGWGAMYPYTEQHGIHGYLRKALWFLRRLELECQLKIRALLDDEVFRIPQTGQSMIVTAGRFKWPIVTKKSGEKWITFTPPSGATEKVSGWQRPTDHWYIVEVRLSWKGLTVYEGRFEVGSFGTAIKDDRAFSMDRYDPSF